MKTLTNAKELPKIYVGLHFVPGLAGYAPPDGEPYKIFINEAAIKKMDPTFKGRPVYVKHVNEVKLSSLQEEADGYVIRSFFNKADGKHWVEFLVVSDLGHEAIRNGWKLSNAYIPTSFAPGGVHNGVEFDKEVMDGEYDHLAIVDDPRYEESRILTQEEFKAYNIQKELELQKLSNSKGERTMGLQFWKRAKIENGGDLEGTVVQLPKSKKEFTIAELVNEMDKIQNMQGYASDDHMVKLNDSEEMSVKELRDCYGKMKSSMEEEEKKKNEKMGDEQDEKKEPKEHNEGEDDAEMNADDEEMKKKNEKMGDEQDEKKEPKESNKKNSADKKKPSKHDELLNASDKGSKDEDRVIDLMHNQLARGKSRYGSG